MQQFDMFTRQAVQVTHNERNVREGDGRVWLRTESETAAMKAERLTERARIAAELPALTEGLPVNGDGEGPYADLERIRPRKRSQCKPTRAALVSHLEATDPVRIAAPCPFVSCEHHIHLDVGDGGITVFDLDGTHTCALDVAESETAARSHEALAVILGLTAEGVRQIEIDATATARANGVQLAPFAVEEERARELVKAERLVQIKRKPALVATPIEAARKASPAPLPAPLDAMMGPKTLTRPRAF